MRTLTIEVIADLEVETARFLERAERGMATGQYQGEYLSFATPEAFFGDLTPNRWKVVNHLLGAGTVGVRELARRLGRDPKRVLEDTKVLVELGLLEKTARGALHCPYAQIHIDMTLMARSFARDDDDSDAPAIHPVVAAQQTQHRARRAPRHAGA